MTTHAGLELRGAVEAGFDEVLTPDALEFVATLQLQFGDTRNKLLDARRERRERLAAGEMLDFLSETQDVRESDWTVAPVPADMQQRWVEITGPTERKMTINALNSGADGFMADFEDANAPTWRNMVEGHINLRDAIGGTITYDGSDGRHYELVENPATLLVRPRGWHLAERHLLVDGEPVAGAFFDFGLYLFHCAPRLLAKGSAPYFYLPKHRERAANRRQRRLPVRLLLADRSRRGRDQLADEDAATAEISRSQIWQWVHHGARLSDGRTVTCELVRQVLDEETAKIREAVGEETWCAGRPAETREIFDRVALSEQLYEFLTIPAYEYLD